MHLLALDTAGPRVSVAIGHNGRLLAEVSIDGARRHAEQVAPAIEFLCESVGIEPAGFGAVAVGIGPGLFTGLRVGVTTARAIAQCLRDPGRRGAEPRSRRVPAAPHDTGWWSR